MQRHHVVELEHRLLRERGQRRFLPLHPGPVGFLIEATADGDVLYLELLDAEEGVQVGGAEGARAFREG